MEHNIKVVFAVGAHGEFGNGDGLPWGAPLKGDMEHFREFTKGCVLVMGAKTYESLPKRLDDLDRMCVVIGRTKPVDKICAKNGELPNHTYATSGADLAYSLNQIMLMYNKPVCVIGGAELIKASTVLADEIMFTTVTNGSVDESHKTMPHTVSLDTSYLGTKNYPDGCVVTYNPSDTIYRKHLGFSSSDDRLETKYITTTRWLSKNKPNHREWYER
ncbi:dihydrofolate reductase [Vibrio phage henriette 12B8]|uniref:dihydrofolate reductase n=1 Tax=Vibrio phage henriette 12B8 TaxID=573174 RepID=UPI0002C14426|nr:dihydrofolate reductase [Vibrio phage henriette 12B8]AGG58212.1 dihydrofolate reductase [Vibrio phage henriette 12B8]